MCSSTWSNSYSTIIYKQSGETPIKATALLYIGSDGTKRWYIDFTTKYFNDIDKIKISLDADYIGSENWSKFLLLNNDNPCWYAWTENEYFPKDGDTLPGVFLIENA